MPFGEKKRQQNQVADGVLLPLAAKWKWSYIVFSWSLNLQFALIGTSLCFVQCEWCDSESVRYRYLIRLKADNVGCFYENAFTHFVRWSSCLHSLASGDNQLLLPPRTEDDCKWVPSQADDRSLTLMVPSSKCYSLAMNHYLNSTKCRSQCNRLYVSATFARQLLNKDGGRMMWDENKKQIYLKLSHCAHKHRI